MNSASKLKVLLHNLPSTVKLVLVTKQQSVESIMEIYNAGYKVFGENRVQELTNKKELLPDDIEWHLIGHLQTNKVKYIAEFISMIHSVDSYKLLEEINKYAKKNDRVIDCLLQFHIATEETKYGLDIAESESILTNPEIQLLKNIQIRGVMGMATFTEDMSLVRNEFVHLYDIFNFLKVHYFADNHNFTEISMGMSSDYMIAIEEGSTIVRIGSKIFH